MNTINSYHYNVSYELKGEALFVSGIVFKAYKELTFAKGTTVSIKFNQKNQQAIIQKITPSKVHLNLANGKKKVVSHCELISENIWTSVLLRIENEDGIGPYRSPNPTPELSQWRKEKQEQLTQERMEGINKHPTPSEDPSISDMPQASYLGIFGFKDMEQCNNWFSKEDLELLNREGFKIVFKQEGKDFFASIYSSYQVVMFSTEERYKQALYHFY